MFSLKYHVNSRFHWKPQAIPSLKLHFTTKQPHCHLICFAYSVLLLQQLSANLPRTNDIWIVSCYCQKCHIAFATSNKLTEPEDVLCCSRCHIAVWVTFVTAIHNPSACHIAWEVIVMNCNVNNGTLVFITKLRQVDWTPYPTRCHIDTVSYWSGCMPDREFFTTDANADKVGFQITDNVEEAIEYTSRQAFPSDERTPLPHWLQQKVIGNGNKILHDKNLLVLHE